MLCTYKENIRRTWQGPTLAPFFSFFYSSYVWKLNIGSVLLMISFHNIEFQLGCTNEDFSFSAGLVGQLMEMI